MKESRVSREEEKRSLELEEGRADEGARSLRRVKESKRCSRKEAAKESGVGAGKKQ
jgi:hypothetical protein